MTTFVLVHGSWHDGSAWGPVIKHLEGKGHRAFGPTVAGHGKGIANRLGLFRLVQMPGSHEVIFSNPVGLAGKNYRSRT